jgi:hypothetical protein
MSKRRSGLYNDRRAYSYGSKINNVSNPIILTGEYIWGNLVIGDIRVTDDPPTDLNLSLGNTSVIIYGIDNNNKIVIPSLDFLNNNNLLITIRLSDNTIITTTTTKNIWFSQISQFGDVSYSNSNRSFPDNITNPLTFTSNKQNNIVDMSQEPYTITIQVL